MKIQTMSLVVGGKACNARCPYCVSKMSGLKDVDNDNYINYDNLRKACNLAKIGGVTTILLTGKGEPTLYFPMIINYLQFLNNNYKNDFPFIELQTNGLRFDDSTNDHDPFYRDWLNRNMSDWKRWGLNTIIISIVHYEKEKNKSIFTPDKEYMDLEKVIKLMHNYGMMVRLNCTMLKGYICGYLDIRGLIEYAKENEVEQISVRPVRTPAVPKEGENIEIYNWTKEHSLDDDTINNIRAIFDDKHTKLMELAHGGTIYDVNGISVCLTDCLTIRPEEKDMLRQIIFFPNGLLKYDWVYDGAILLRGNK